MGGPVWKRINVVGARVVNGLNVAGYGRSGPEKSWTVSSLLSDVYTERDNDVRTGCLVFADRRLTCKRSICDRWYTCFWPVKPMWIGARVRFYEGLDSHW